VQRLGRQLHDAPYGDGVTRPDIINDARSPLLGNKMYRTRQIVRVNIGLLRTTATVKWQLPPKEPANNRLGDDPMQKLPRAVCVRRSEDIHRKVQYLVDRN